MIDSDDPRTIVARALGHICVPFSTEEEANEGCDSIILLLLQAFKALIKEKEWKISPRQLLGEFWLGLSPLGEDGYKLITARLLDTLEVVEKFESKDTPIEDKKLIKIELKSRGLI
jgi:hypothetical protein